MTRTRKAAVVAAVVAFSVPATAHAARVSGVVISKDKTRGTFVLAGRSGAATTVRAPRAHPRLGDKLLVDGARLAGGMVRARSLRVVGHTRHATLHAVVVRQLTRRTLVSAGASVISLWRHGSNARSLSMVSNHRRGLTAGSVASFGLSISSTGVTQTTTTALGVTSNVRIEGHVVSVSPLVISIEGLPITITVPGGVTLPPGLQPGDELELTVSVGADNTFTLVSADDQNAEEQQNAGDDDQGDDNDDQGDDDGGSAGSGPTGSDHGGSGSGGGDDGGGSGGGDD